MTKQKITTDEETIEPEKIIPAKKRRVQVIEETIICPICKREVVFKITNRFLDGVLKKTERKQETWSHDPLKCLHNVATDFETKSEVEKCGNCKQWAGGYDSCGGMKDEYCEKHSRYITKKEFDWIKKFYPEKLKQWGGENLTFKDMQVWYRKLKYICYEDEWCEHYEDDR